MLLPPELWPLLEEKPTLGEVLARGASVIERQPLRRDWRLWLRHDETLRHIVPLVAASREGRPGAALADARTRAHFDALAPTYDELRGPSRDVTPLVEAVVAVGDLAGRHVLDVGCGTGRTLATLAAHYGVSGAGVDSSPDMVEQARVRLPDGLSATVASAEALPFPDATFERAYMVFVVHHLDRPRAFAEIRRVLAWGGRLTIATSDPDAFGRFWMAALFPSYVAIERGRFPSAGTLFAELEAAGYVEPSCEQLAIARVFSRAEALEKLRGRAYSTFVHLDEREYARGLATAERELLEEVRYQLELLLVTATRARSESPAS